MKNKVVLLALLIVMTAPLALAHCDTVSGPVAADVTAALAASDVTPVLKWIKPQYEPELRSAFALAVAARKQGGQSAVLADRYFLETAVRLHRGGEGAPYDGIKDTPVPAEIAAADQALARRDASSLADDLSAGIAAGIRQRFAVAAAARPHAGDSVEAGRTYVAAYVELMHYLEAVHHLASAGVAAGEHAAEQAHR